MLEGALSNKARARANQDESGSNGKRGGGSDSSGGGGPLAKSAVVAGMNGVKGKVAACYTQFKVPGMAMVNVVISKSGKVTSASATGKFAGTPTGTLRRERRPNGVVPPVGWPHDALSVQFALSAGGTSSPLRDPPEISDRRRRGGAAPPGHKPELRRL